MSVLLLAVLGLTLDDTLTRLNALKQVLAFSVNIAAAVFFLGRISGLVRGGGHGHRCADRRRNWRPDGRQTAARGAALDDGRRPASHRRRLLGEIRLESTCSCLRALTISPAMTSERWAVALDRFACFLRHARRGSSGRSATLLDENRAELDALARCQCRQLGRAGRAARRNAAPPVAHLVAGRAHERRGQQRRTARRLQRLPAAAHGLAHGSRRKTSACIGRTKRC